MFRVNGSISTYTGFDPNFLIEFTTTEQVNAVTNTSSFFLNLDISLVRIYPCVPP